MGYLCVKYETACMIRSYPPGSFYINPLADKEAWHNVAVGSGESEHA